MRRWLTISLLLVGFLTPQAKKHEPPRLKKSDKRQKLSLKQTSGAVTANCWYTAIAKVRSDSDAWYGHLVVLKSPVTCHSCRLMESSGENHSVDCTGAIDEPDVLSLVDGFGGSLATLRNSSAQRCDCAGIIGSLKSETKKLKAEITDCKAKLYDGMQSESKLRDAVFDLKESERRVQKYKNHSAKLMKEVESLKAVQTVTVAPATVDQDEKSALLSRIRELESSLRGKEELCTQLQTGLESFRSQVAAAAEKHATSRAQGSAMKGQLAGANAKITLLETKLKCRSEEDVTAVLSATPDEKDKKIAELTKASKVLEAEVLQTAGQGAVRQPELVGCGVLAVVEAPNSAQEHSRQVTPVRRTAVDGSSGPVLPASVTVLGKRTNVEVHERDTCCLRSPGKDDAACPTACVRCSKLEVEVNNLSKVLKQEIQDKVRLLQELKQKGRGRALQSTAPLLPAGVPFAEQMTAYKVARQCTSPTLGVGGVVAPRDASPAAKCQAQPTYLLQHIQSPQLQPWQDARVQPGLCEGIDGTVAGGSMCKHCAVLRASMAGKSRDVTRLHKDIRILDKNIHQLRLRCGESEPIASVSDALLQETGVEAVCHSGSMATAAAEHGSCRSCARLATQLSETTDLIVRLGKVKGAKGWLIHELRVKCGDVPARKAHARTAAPLRSSVEGGSYPTSPGTEWANKF
jgi:hypothetical protein